MQDISEARDEFETAILLALDARDSGRDMHRRSTQKEKSGSREYWDFGAFCPKKAEYPRDAYAYDPASSDRWYYTGMDNVVVDPIMAIGAGLETMILCEDGSLKWSKFTPMPKPRGLVAITNQPHRWFSAHFRHIQEGRKDDYFKKPFVINEDGSIPLLKLLNGKGLDAKAERDEAEEQLSLALSIFEDAIRSSSFLATVEESVKLRFPVGADAYKDFLKLRDGYRNTPTQRKNPILHWCREHMRKSASGVVSEIDRHLRGAEEIVVGPMRLSVQANEGYAHLIKEQTPPES